MQLNYYLIVLIITLLWISKLNLPKTSEDIKHAICFPFSNFLDRNTPGMTQTYAAAWKQC